MISRRKYIYYFAALLTIAVMTGCAGASAPPLDLPAPVTGQIDVSGPSAEGKATVTGNEGAVTGGSTVLAINDSEVEASLWQVTDFLFPKAYAQALPGVCDLVGRSCAEAGADGTFTLNIDAVVGDDIILVLISSDGEEISDRVTVTVPAGTGIEACGSGFEGSLVAIADVGGAVYSLFEGSEEKANVFKVGSQEFEIPGCYAKDIAVIEESSGTKLIAVVSSSDNTLWIGRWNGTSLTMGLTYTTDIEPQKAAFAGDSTEVIVSGKGNSLYVELISVADGSTINSIELPEISQDTVVALDTVGPFADGGYLGMIVGTNGTRYYLSFFNAENGDNITPGGKINLVQTLWISINNDPEVTDAAIGVDPQAGDQVRFLFTDRVSLDPAFRYTPVSEDGTNISLNDGVGDLLSLALPVNDIYSQDSLANTYPLRFAEFTNSANPSVYILKDDGYLWTIENIFGVPVPHLDSLALILPDALVIAIDETGTSLTGGNAAGTTTDLSSYIIP